MKGDGIFTTAVYAVFYLLGKFHSLFSSYFNTHPIPTPTLYQHTCNFIVNGCPRGGGLIHDYL